MAKVSGVIAVNISLEVDEKQSLFILLAADGSINRLGTGKVNNKENDLFIGITTEPLLSELMMHLTDEMLQFMGGYEIPDQRGASCRLSIGLIFADGEQNGFGFSYGSKSKGPPYEIGEFVIAAVRVTDPWFQAQKRMVETSSNENKPWWKLW